MRRKAGEAWEYQTDIGTLTFSPVEDLFDPLCALLCSGIRNSSELEDTLADKFKLTEPERTALLKNKHRAWENHVAWALSRLNSRKTISKVGTKRVQGRGTRGLYQLNTAPQS